jgi:hypothetical protein
VAYSLFGLDMLLFKKWCGIDQIAAFSLFGLDGLLFK